MSKVAKSIAVLGVVAGLGVAALPLGTYAATEDITINAIVDNTISLTTSASEVTMNLIPGGSAVEKEVTATVVTNNNAGYTLSIKDSDSTTALVSEKGDTIAAGVALSGSTSAWAYKGGSKNTWTEITTGDVELVNVSKPTPAPDPVQLGDPADTVITFGAYAAEGQQNGTYKGGVTLTAVAQ